LFDEEMAFTPDMRNRQKVLQTIRRHPGIVLRDVLRNCGLLKRNLEPVIEALIAEGLVADEANEMVPIVWRASGRAAEALARSVQQGSGVHGDPGHIRRVCA
jgi:hypothetical protein